jgi:hypothetical protein
MDPVVDGWVRAIVGTSGVSPHLSCQLSLVLVSHVPMEIQIGQRSADKTQYRRPDGKVGDHSRREIQIEEITYRCGDCCRKERQRVGFDAIGCISSIEVDNDSFVSVFLWRGSKERRVRRVKGCQSIRGCLPRPLARHRISHNRRSANNCWLKWH